MCPMFQWLNDPFAGKGERWDLNFLFEYIYGVFMYLVCGFLGVPWAFICFWLKMELYR